MKQKTESILKDDTTNEKNNENKILNKRNFFKLILGGIGTLFAATGLYPVLKYLSAPLKLEDSSVTEVEEDISTLPVDASRMIKFGGKPLLLIRHSEKNITAFGATCTHLACTVQYQAKQQRIYCACHGSVYDPNTGERLAGPAPKALPNYVVEFKDEKTIKITRPV